MSAASEPLPDAETAEPIEVEPPVPLLHALSERRALRLSAARCVAYGLCLALLGYQPALLVILSAWTLAPASLLAEAGRARAQTRGQRLGLVVAVAVAVWLGFLVAMGQVAYGKAILEGQSIASALESAARYLDIGERRRGAMNLLPAVYLFLGIPAVSFAGALLLRARRGPAGPSSMSVLGTCLALVTIPFAIPVLLQRGAGDAGFLVLWAAFVSGVLFVGVWLLLFLVDWFAAPRDR
ncbi:MAG TPA: hypothetical protein DEA08_14770 [Planctomycetes bacterium]|nr:hypothetical protein [Planctomycetota bacterium]